MNMIKVLILGCGISLALPGARLQAAEVNITSEIESVMAEEHG